MPWWGWAAVILLFVLLIGSTEKKGTKERQAKPCRIDHPHYVSADESECSVCHARFRQKAASCPKCGVRFAAVKEDRREWEEQFDEECEMDEEDGL